MNEKIYYVYEWIRLDTYEPFYIGKGKNNRYKKLTRGNNRHFNNIVKTIPTAVYILHDNLTDEEANGIECWYIHEYKYVIGYDLVNITDGGEGATGFKATEEQNKNNRARIHGFDIHDHKDEIIDLYINKYLSTIDIGKKYNVSKRCINSLLKRHNIKLRTSGETISINQIGDKRYNSKYIVITDCKNEIIKVCESGTKFHEWAYNTGLTPTIGCAKKSSIFL